MISRGGTISRYALNLFTFDNLNIPPAMYRVLRDYVGPDILEGSCVTIIGYTDVIGLDDRNQRLSEQRARAVANAIEKNVKPGLIASLTVKGAGETDPIYRNDLAEGRFYNRTVTIEIVTPNPYDSEK